jgi:transposase-like protein
MRLGVLSFSLRRMSQAPKAPKVKQALEKLGLVNVCELIADGGSVRDVAQSLGVSRSYLHAWLRGTPERKQAYEAAQLAKMEMMGEELLELAAKAPERLAGEKGGGVDAAEVANRRLQIDTMKWVMAKTHRERWGDVSTQQITGAEGAPLVVQVVRFSPPAADA